MAKKILHDQKKNCPTNKNFARLEKNLRDYKKIAGLKILFNSFGKKSFAVKSPNSHSPKIIFPLITIYLNIVVYTIFKHSTLYLSI
jgi:hypothetical protein